LTNNTTYANNIEYLKNKYMPETSIQAPPSELAHLQAPEARSDINSRTLRNESVFLDAATSIYDPSEIGLAAKDRSGNHVSVVGEIAIVTEKGINEAAIIKVVGLNGTQAFGLMGLLKNENGQTIADKNRAVKLESNSQNVVGRQHHTGAATITDTDLWGEPAGTEMSRAHVEINIEGNQVKVTDRSTNGTDLRGKEAVSESVEPFHYESTHTMHKNELLKLLGKHRQEDGVEYFVDSLGKSREIITRDTFPIEGKVDVRSFSRDGYKGEAIVVDSLSGDNESRSHYEALLTTTMTKIAKESKRYSRNLSELEVAKIIGDTVGQKMEYDLKYVDELSEYIAKNRPEDRKINLSVYLAGGKGVCRHMGLASAWLGGELVKAGLLDGKITTQVNQSTKGNGAHEWARYTPKNGGEPIIIDVAQGFTGTLSDVYQKTAKGERIWGYFKDAEEQGKYKQLVESREAIAKEQNKKPRFFGRA
jgi:hypothetical protein